MASRTAKSSKTTVAVSSPPILIHETNEKGFHRIVKISNGGSQYGEWTKHDAVAVLDNYRAATSHFSEALPQGIFVTQSKQYTVL